VTITKLPFWARKYVEHIREHRPQMYKDLEQSGELEALALSIQESASAAYERLVEANKLRGDNERSAELFAEGDVMRQFILLPTEQDVPVLGEDMDEMAEEPEDAFEPGHLELLNDLNDWSTRTIDPG
jgi:Transposon-encoded protein TnpV